MPPSRDNIPGSSVHHKTTKLHRGLKIASIEHPSVAPRRSSPIMTPTLPRPEPPYRSECKRLKIPRLHPMQKSVIDSIISRPHKDQFIIAATGSGKSILFELPAILPASEHKITIVFIPRISIIRMELERLLACGITAEARYSKKNSAEVASQNKLLFEGLQDPSTLPKILLVTPNQLEHMETSLQTLLVGLYERSLIYRFVFDEAHMLFDNSQLINYLRNLRLKFPQVPATVLSASLSPATAMDLRGLLKINSRPQVFPLDRPNLYYSVISKYSSGELSREKGDQNAPKKKDISQLSRIEYLANQKYPDGAGLVYCRTKEGCKRIANLLTSGGIHAEYFDAERGDTGEGYEILSKWIRNDPTVRVIVSTVALSSGVHKPDVRFVVHTSIPTSGIDGYMQETGRAGRDGRDATLYAFDDAFKVPQDTRHEAENVCALLRFIHAADCRRRMLLSYYGDNHYAYGARRSRCCDICDNPTAWKQLNVTPVARRVLRFYSNFELKNGPIGMQALAEKLQKTIGSNQKTTAESWKRLVQWLIIERYLEKDKPGARGGGQTKVIRGPRLNNILQGGGDKVWLPWSMQFNEYYLGRSDKHWPRIWTEEMVDKMTEIELDDSSRSVSPDL